MGEFDAPKRAAAERAVEEIEDGMVVGLGTGSTAAFAIEAIAARVRQGLRIVGIPTSEKSADQARRLAIPLSDFARHRRIDVTIDGADQVARGTLDLVKGLGGALLREKIVASASDRMIVVADSSKLVDLLGAQTLVPVEIVSFGFETVLDRLIALGCAPLLRMAGGRPFATDGGNYIADCAIASIADPAGLAARIKALVGVVETGLFVGLASKVIIGGAGGVEVLER